MLTILDYLGYLGSTEHFCLVPIFYDGHRSLFGEWNILTSVFYAFYFSYYHSKRSANENFFLLFHTKGRITIDQETTEEARNDVQCSARRSAIIPFPYFFVVYHPLGRWFCKFTFCSRQEDGCTGKRKVWFINSLGEGAKNHYRYPISVGTQGAQVLPWRWWSPWLSPHPWCPLRWPASRTWPARPCTTHLTDHLTYNVACTVSVGWR